MCHTHLLGRLWSRGTGVDRRRVRGGGHPSSGSRSGRSHTRQGGRFSRLHLRLVSLRCGRRYLKWCRGDWCCGRCRWTTSGRRLDCPGLHRRRLCLGRSLGLGRCRRRNSRGLWRCQRCCRRRRGRRAGGCGLDLGRWAAGCCCRRRRRPCRCHTASRGWRLRGGGSENKSRA